MGLDSVELVMAFEEAFGIDIPNSVAERMVTPRAVVDYVSTRVPLVPSGPCATQRTFYQLRRAIRETIADAPQLRPVTRVSDLTTRGDWTAVWERVRDAAGSPRWPEVRWHRWPMGGPKTLRALTWSIMPPGRASRRLARRGVDARADRTAGSPGGVAPDWGGRLLHARRVRQ